MSEPGIDYTRWKTKFLAMEARHLRAEAERLRCAAVRREEDAAKLEAIIASRAKAPAEDPT